MEDKELFNPQNGEKIAPKKPKQFWKDWRFYVYTLIAIMLAIVSLSSCLTACAAINAGVGQKEDASYSVAQRKNAVTTLDSGYTAYTFTASDLAFPTEDGYAIAYYYQFDDSTGSLVDGSVTSVTYSASTLTAVYSTIEEVQNYWTISGTSIYFSIVCGRSPFWSSASRYWVYYTFQMTSTLGTYYAFNYSSAYRLTSSDSWTNAYVADSSGVQGVYSYVNFSSVYPKLDFPVLTKNSYLLFRTASASGDTAPTSFTFQDCYSFYLNAGYTAGYSDGYDEGYSVGTSDGYSSGYDVGYSDGNSYGYSDGYASGYEDGNSYGYSSGYEAGYSQATEDYNTGIAFTSYGLYANAQLTLVTDETIGNYDYMYLFDYVTSNYDEHTVYVLFLYVSSSDTYLGYVLDRNNSDIYSSAVTIGSFTGQTSTTVTITAEMDQYFELYDGYVTSFYDRGAEVIEAVWFSGGTSQTGLQNYQDGYNDGYDDGQQAGYSSGYDAGYAVGEVDGANSVDPEALTTTLVTLFQQPFNQIYRFFNFNVLGLNILGLVTGLFTVFIIWKIYKKVF